MTTEETKVCRLSDGPSCWVDGTASVSLAAIQPATCNQAGYPFPVAERHQLSPSAHQRLKTELEDLTTRGRIDIARKIETARELGDLSENGDYHAAKEEQGKMEGRIAHLSKMLENAEVVDSAPTGADRVQAGCVVGITYEGDDVVEQYLLGSIEEQHDDFDVISPGSPLGAALMGAAVGDTVGYEAPGGVLKVTVASIDA